MRILRRLLQLSAVLLCAAASAGPTALPPPEAGALTVYFLDVGQGDAALLVSPTGKTLLIDGGPPEAGPGVVRAVRSVTEGPLDLLVLSHAHLDHLGGLRHVVERVGARRYLEPGFNHASSSYRDLLRRIAQKKIAWVDASPGADGAPWSVDIGDGARLTVLWPRAPKEPYLARTRSDVNANSLVLRVTWRDTAFLFTGDAEADTEARLLRGAHALGANVLKVAHHGSRFSSQAPFLSRVAPDVAVISCGNQNDYRHPHGKALKRLQAAGAAVARTDLHGTVRVVSDGRQITVDALGRDGAAARRLGVYGATGKPQALSAAVERKAEPRRDVDEPRGSATSRYAASRRSKVFHAESCPSVQRIHERNLVLFDSREAAMQDHRPSGDCSP